MYRPSWITKSQLEVAYEKGLKILNNFDRATDGEQSWTEIEIDGKFFDIECYQEKEQDDVVCNVYPTYPTRAENREKQMPVKRLDSAQRKGGALMDNITNVQEAWDKNGTKLLVALSRWNEDEQKHSGIFREKYDLDPTDVIKYNCLPGEMFEDRRS